MRHRGGGFRAQERAADSSVWLPVSGALLSAEELLLWELLSVLLWEELVEALLLCEVLLLSDEEALL